MGWWVSCRVDLALLSLAYSSCFSAVYKNISSLCPRTLFFLFLHPSLSANLSFPSPSLCPHISYSPLISIHPSLSSSLHPCVPLSSQVRKGGTGGPASYGGQHLSGSTEMGRYMVSSHSLRLFKTKIVYTVHLRNWDYRLTLFCLLQIVQGLGILTLILHFITENLPSC